LQQDKTDLFNKPSHPPHEQTTFNTPWTGVAMSEQTAGNAPIPKRRRFRIVRMVALLALLLVVLILTAPWIVAHSSLRDTAINSILASPSVNASSDSASFGWFSPIAVDGLHLKSTNNHVDVRMELITAQKSLLQLWSTAPDLGPIDVEKVHVLLELPLDIQLQEPHRRLEPTFSATVKNAALTVQLAGQSEKVIEVDGISMTFRVEKEGQDRVLTLDPMVIFDRRELSPKLASKLVNLFDPTMSDTSHVRGAFSLSLDKLRIPVGVPKDQAVKHVELEGKLVLHDVYVQVSNAMRQALVRLVADLNGKKASDVVRLAHNAEIRFKVHDGRLYHEGLRIGFPDIDPKLELTSRGSVGLDKTLDLSIELPRLDEDLRKEKGPAICRITGTIASPIISVQDGSLVLRPQGHTTPLIAAAGINLKMQVETTASGHALVVEPVEIFKNQKLSLGVADGLMKFIAPDVRSERQVGGEVSLAFSKLRVPLGVGVDQTLKQFQAEGKLGLHQVSAAVKSPMWLGLIRMLADLDDRQPPGAIHIVEDSEIRFRVQDGRLYYDGLHINCPELDPALVIRSHGSVGLDESLDLVVELPRLDEIQKDKGPAICRITGTIANPKITVEDGSLVLRQHGRKQPIFAANGINLSMEVQPTDWGHALVVEPVEVFKHKKLNVGLADGLMKYIAPDFHGERQLSGEISLSLSKLRIPLGVAQDQAVKHIVADGKLSFHQVAAEINSPMWQGLIRLVADMNGKKLPDVIRIVEDSDVLFQVRDGRLQYDGLRIGLPEIDPGWVITSRGSIGLDESLQLSVELPRLASDKRDSRPVQCSVTGTIDQPKIAVADASLVVQLTEGDKAALTVDNVDLSFSVETAAGVRMLKLAPVTLFKKQKLTPEVGERLIHLISPTLGDLAGVQGEFSLSLDNFAVPLGVEKNEFVKKVALAGKLELHDITLSVKTPLLQTLVKMLADMHGKKPSDVVRVVQKSDVRFSVKDGRMYHEGLRFGFPDISPDLLISSQGSVGYDKSLDLVLEIPRVLVDLQGAQTQKLDPVRLRVTGTIDAPIVTEIKATKGK
jgi:hypothetical protein